jgi:hypothetical protein
LSNAVTNNTNDDDNNMEQSTPWLQKLNRSERTKEAISACCRQLFAPSPGLELTSARSATTDSPFASPDSSFASPPLATFFKDVITYSPAPFASPSPLSDLSEESETESESLSFRSVLGQLGLSLKYIPTRLDASKNNASQKEEIRRHGVLFVKKMF